MADEKRLLDGVRQVLLLSGMALLGGCAAFNDVVVVDVGEQFHLLEMVPGADTARTRATLADGFDCTFSATSVRSSLFAREKRIDGTIRCQRFGTE